MSNASGRVPTLKQNGRVVIVGASLAGLRAAETLRAQGFGGCLTLIGDEPHQPYDRPPLSKSVLAGTLPLEHTILPQFHKLGADWCLGVPAARLDLEHCYVELADGQQVGFDRLLIATGTRARTWPNKLEAAFDGVYTLRNRDDAAMLRRRLLAPPRHVLIIGGGFIGSEAASVCRGLGLPVTVAERGPAPLCGALGCVIGDVAADMQREHGVDLRCGVSVLGLESDDKGRLRRAHFSDGTSIDTDVAIIALGAVRNTEWLRGSGLAADARGVACDASCRVFTEEGIVTDDIFVAGDVARWPHTLYGDQLIAVEHWDNAVQQAEIAAHNMLAEPSQRRAHRTLPAFWSYQFDVSIKSVGIPTVADELALVQGSFAQRRFIAVYGQQGRMVAAVAFDSGKTLPAYQRLIEEAAPFPPVWHGPDTPPDLRPQPARFPPRSQPTHSPKAETTGTTPIDPRVPPSP